MKNAPARNAIAALAKRRRGELTGERNYAGSHGSQVFADEAAEQVVLASMLNGSNGQFPDADLFFYQSHQAIHRGFAALNLRGIPADIVTLSEALRESGELESAGGDIAITNLGIDYIAKSPELVRYELDKLHDLRAKREQRAIGEKMLKGEITPEQAREALAEISGRAREHQQRLIEFRSPQQLKYFTPLPGIVLIGDNHIVKGSVFVIGGAPGVGKSRATVALGEAGATGYEWFGLSVHRKFKTMIIQNENGEFRLSKEFGELNCDVLEDFVRVCAPPPYGFCFQRDDFRAQLKAAITDFEPDVVVFDPWNAAARDEKAREYLESFDLLKSVLPVGDDMPALAVVAHTRKPKTDERASGRALLNLLAGSYVLGSVPRTVFVMQAASDDTTDNRVVWTCAKNNDGELGKRSAWTRCNGLFTPVDDFDFEAFDAPEKDKREVITEDAMRAVFENGALTKTEARVALENMTGAKRSTCYYALDPNGRFAKHLNLSKGKLSWK